MFGGVLKTTSRLALIATAGTFISGIGISGAAAADLGGDCCADLEERVAELEATTVRKGKRQLSMTISGRVHYAVMHWDDGGSDESVWLSSDTVVSNPLSSSRIRIDGRAKIREGWEAGYRFSFIFEETGRGIQMGHTARPTDSSIEAEEAYWFVRSARLGAISVGTRGQSYDGAAKVDVTGQLGQVANPDPRLYGGGIRFRDSLDNSTALTMNPAFQVDDGDNGAGERSGVRYDSPNIGGFIFSADWVNDGIHDVYGARVSFAKQINDFRIAAAAAWYQEETIGDYVTNEVSGVLGSLGIKHTKTGLFINTGAGEVDYDDVTDVDDPFFWYVTAGIQRKWNSLGATAVYGQYYFSDDNDAVAASNSEFESTYWGFGVSQAIDAASMQVYAGYRQYETDALVDGVGLEDIDVFLAGGIINF